MYCRAVWHCALRTLHRKPRRENPVRPLAPRHAGLRPGRRRRRRARDRSHGRLARSVSPPLGCPTSSGISMTVAHIYTVAFQGIEARSRRAGPYRRGRRRAFQYRRPGRQGGRRKPRAGARRAVGHRPGAALQAHHRQSGAGRSAQGRQPLRSSHRAGPAGGDGRAAGQRDGQLCRAGRIVARCGGNAGGGRAERGHGGQRAASRPDLSGRLRAGSGLGRRDRDHRHAVADRAGQSHEGRAGAEPAGRQAGDDDARRARPARRQGPGKRQRALEIAAAGGHNC